VDDLRHDPSLYGLEPGAGRAVCAAASLLRSGGVIAYPTEGVWGIGCDPRQRIAVHRVLRIKQRPVEKGLILIAAEFAQLEPFLLPLPEPRMREIEASWPGPNTWLMPARPAVPDWLRGEHETLAVRVTDHPMAAALCRAAGTALVSTSANLAGEPPARSVEVLEASLGRRVDYILRGALGGREGPSIIRDALTGEVVRGG
jgi:L-threonylcarbamoyladenylate synthase